MRSTKKRKKPQYAGRELGAKEKHEYDQLAEGLLKRFDAFLLSTWGKPHTPHIKMAQRAFN